MVFLSILHIYSAIDICRYPGPVTDKVMCDDEVAPEGYSRRIDVFDCKNQWSSSLDSAQAQLGRVGRASINTGCLLVCGSRCWQLLSCLSKKCYHSCHTDLVREMKRFSHLEILGRRFWFSQKTIISMDFTKTCYRPKLHLSHSPMFR